ncbi:MAG: XamI family restriction endonuclease [Coriobacteriaceae bacterium]|jgi:hypothetical protein|nr:XamI family restriction endonuclease [Coriobacteriaceae bacterium]
MGINNDKPHLWKSDIDSSIDYYNRWFMEFAPAVFRDTRVKTTLRVNETLELTDNLISLSPAMLLENPWILPILRMSTCPPLARDRLSGLAGVSRTLISGMEEKGNPHLPKSVSTKQLYGDMGRIVDIINNLIDPDIFTWFDDQANYGAEDVWRAASVVADRLCGSDTNPIIRNEQERRQLTLVKGFLEAKGYHPAKPQPGSTFKDLPPGKFSFHLNVPGKLENDTDINIPVDIVVKRKNRNNDEFPLLIEAKSAGDYANVNKRRKEEANKLANLRRAYGKEVRLNLLLCGYFDPGYLGYVAAEGCDWVWEHRLSDLEQFGL